jgi:deoxyribodipyrimidine photo-lyase
MTTAIVWFRNDLRLTDNAAFAGAWSASEAVVAVYVRSADETMNTEWGFPRWGSHRRRFRDQALEGLGVELASRGVTLLVLDGDVADLLPPLAREAGAAVFCETIAAPEEMAQVAALRKAGLAVHEIWQSSLLNPADLPFGIDALPDVFTRFRQAVERGEVSPRPPSSATPEIRPDVDAAVDGSETGALAHVARYFASAAPQSYKQTRNGLTGTGYSTGFSPWLAVGALSARTIFQQLRAYEARFGANDDSTYWIWFELLWRDFFHFQSLKHGARMFRARGLGQLPPPAHDSGAFSRWCAGNTGHAFVDAGLRDLAATGTLSNRMRQVVASYLVHELACDWRAGAAWFESRLIDYDVCSNHGNWLSIAGRGAGARQGRRFNPDKQAAEYDPDGAYRALWAEPSVARAP